MGKRKKRTSDKVVQHPRFGGASIPSGFHATEQIIRDSFWGYKDANIFVDSAIPADTSRQNFSTFPRGYYVDLLKICRDCNRKFIFFAREQQYWFEELKLYVDVDCVRCSECRKKNRDLKRRYQRYSETIGLENPTAETLELIVTDIVVLWTEKMVQNENTLRRIRNLANEFLPECEATKAINGIVNTLNSASIIVKNKCLDPKRR